MKEFRDPEIEIVQLNTEDVLTASGRGDDDTEIL